MSISPASWQEQLQSALDAGSLDEAKECFSFEDLSRIDQQDLVVEALFNAYSDESSELPYQIADWLDRAIKP